MSTSQDAVSGVQELIDQLKMQGVEAGNAKASQIINEAKDQASRMIADAQSKVDQLYSEAHHRIETEKIAAQESIKIAFRDAELHLRSKFKEAFSSSLKRLISSELQDKNLIKQIVLAIAGTQTERAASAEKLEVALPTFCFQKDQSGMPIKGEEKDPLSKLVLGITSQMLREGVEFKPSSSLRGGIRVKLIGKDLDIDLSDEAFSSLLLSHLLPRYRAIISGQESHS